MKKQKESALSNAKIAIIFFVFLIFIVLISLILKTAAVIRASKFDNSKRFTLSIANGKNIEIMSLFSGSKNVTVFKLDRNIKPIEAGRLLEIPIDGSIEFKSQDLNQKIDSLFINAILNYHNLETDLTIIDLFKLALFTKTIPKSSVSVEKVGSAKGLEADKIVGRLAIDALLEKDQQTIQIVNATFVSGLGNRLARLITNMGGNVILVMTEGKSRKKSVITYIDKKTYTVERLQQVLGYETVRKPDNAMSDITIIIGEDRMNVSPF